MHAIYKLIIWFGNNLFCSQDVVQAFEILSVLGKSCGVIKTDDRIEYWLVFCVPEELSLDNTTVIQSIAESGKAYYTLPDLEERLGKQI